jgi:hypothetical protein
VFDDVQKIDPQKKDGNALEKIGGHLKKIIGPPERIDVEKIGGHLKKELNKIIGRENADDNENTNHNDGDNDDDDNAAELIKPGSELIKQREPGAEKKMDIDRRKLAAAMSKKFAK